MSALHLRRICLVGVRGIGKTTLVRSVLHALPDVEHIVGSAVLRELAGAEFAHFDHLPPERKAHYRESAIEWMVNHQARTQKHILCDGHTSLLDESTGTVGPVFTTRDCAFFRELVLLEAPLDLVLERRRQDSSKRRSLDPHTVAAELAGERETAASIAERYGMRLHRLGMATDSQLREKLIDVLT